jgi:hypothetical protein
MALEITVTFIHQSSLISSLAAEIFFLEICGNLQKRANNTEISENKT